VQVWLLRCPRKSLQGADVVNGPKKFFTGKRRVAKARSAVECCEFNDG
jgi:hypothetical protein